MSNQFSAKISAIRKLLNFIEPQIVSTMLDSVFPPDSKLSNKQRNIVHQLRQMVVRLEIDHEVSDYFYLLERSWYIHNPQLQAKVLNAVRRGLGPLINAVAGDFEEDLDDLFLEQEAMFTVMRSDIANFEYLESKSWFMQNRVLQEKVFKVVLAGFGNRIDVGADDFTVYMSNLLL
jgi:hypothetical protein